MNKGIRMFLLMLIDAVLVNIAFYGGLLLRFDGQVPANYIDGYMGVTPFFTMVFLVGFFLFGLYHRLWQYASVGELLSVIVSVSAAMAVNIGVFYLATSILGQYPMPRGSLIIAWILMILLVGGSRLAWRLLRDYGFQYRNGVAMEENAKPILIYGAGDAGAILAKELKGHYSGDSVLVGFIDDDPQKHNVKLLGYPVLGDQSRLEEIVERYGVEEIILAMPSEDRNMIRKIVERCQETAASVKILPGMYDLIEGNVTINQIREVNIEDLLGRDPVKVDLEGICGYLENQVVLVTGAGGSIGSELCRQIIQYHPQALLLFDLSENNIYDIEMELRTQYEDFGGELIPIVKDIRDWQSVQGVFDQYHPNVVFHAAAHKHVPLMEANPEEAVKNNIMGTYHVAKAAGEYHADKFVLVSTDKAVNPTSVMGATKRVAEMLIQYMDTHSGTQYVAVRFGNVLGSRGSVVPLFKKQIANGGPVTVTDQNMVRYFMTIPEAVQLIIQAGAMAKGGEIFVLDMGDPVKIIDLAKTMIKLSGFEPYRDIDIIITGLRPGEKLYEELLSAEEGVNATFHKRIFVAKPNGLHVRLIEDTMKDLDNRRLPRTGAETIAMLQGFIPDFRRVEYGELESGDLQMLESVKSEQSTQSAKLGEYCAEGRQLTV